MNHRVLFIAFALAALVLAASKTDASQITVLSQNTLHLGWGKPTPMATKNGYLVSSVVGTAYDVVMLQEVMPKITINALPWQSPAPGTYLVYQSSAAGASTYKETYGFLVKSTLGVTQNPTGANIICYTSGTISRPPCGVLVNTGTTPTWFVNYHAVFGSVPNRKKEVQQIGTGIRAFQNTAMGSTSTKYNRVVVGGDWNFSAADVTTLVTSSIGGQAFTVTPTGATSLKPTGATSQPYDHFACVTPVTCSSAAVVAPPGGWTNAKYRTDFSDHLGVKVNVQYSP